MGLGPGRLVVLPVLLGVASLPVFGGQAVSAAIPFAFTAGDKEFPAGNYSFEMKSETRQISIKGRKSAIVRSMDLTFRGDVYEVTKRYEIFFRRYGDDYFLAELWIKQFGMEPLKSAAEAAKEAAGESASVIKLKVKSS